MKTVLSKILTTIIFIILLGVLATGCFFLIKSTKNKGNPLDNKFTIDNIGIGGGGAFFNPIVDPTNTDYIYTTCDMGGLYYSHNNGSSWSRTDVRAIIEELHVSKNGNIYTGGYGLYASFDKGKTLNLIYPKNVRYNISRYGTNNENLMIADDYKDGFVKCIASNDNYLYFTTLDWLGELRIFQMKLDGSNFEILYSTTIIVSNYKSGHTMKMLADNSALYYSLDGKIYKFNLTNKTTTTLYTAQENITNFCMIGDYYFIIDDTASKSLILYTKDFVEYHDLMNLNSLSNSYLSLYTFDWHFDNIAGNNFDNIFLTLKSKIKENNNPLYGILKFNGDNFEWILDHFFKPKWNMTLNGWSYGTTGPYYGICPYPNDDNACIISNIETLYYIKYENETNNEIKTLHCTDNDSKYSTTGLNVQTTFFVKEDPFNKDHIMTCTTDLGLQNSFDGGKSWRRMILHDVPNTETVYNTCYDIYFDEYTENKIYSLWSSRHDAPFYPSLSDQGTTRGSFAVSTNGGLTWDYYSSKGIPEDAIPVKMSVKQTKTSITIAVATFNRGFYISEDGGQNFTSISNNMETYEGLIFGEDIIMTDDVIYCLTAPIQKTANEWTPSILYEYNPTSKTTTKINLGEIVLARSITYNKDKGLFISVIPDSYWKNFEEYGGGCYANQHGGIYLYKNNSLSLFFENYDGIFNCNFTSDGTLYATDPFGKVFVVTDNDSKLLIDGLFNGLKYICFSRNEKVMYITTFGGGTYRIKNFTNK